MTDTERIKDLECENRMLRKMQPVTLEGDAATSFVLAAELSEATAKIKELQEDIADYERVEEIRRNREHISHWIDYWRNKTGANDLTYPDWDAIFDDWKNLKKNLNPVKDCTDKLLEFLTTRFQGRCLQLVPFAVEKSAQKIIIASTVVLC